MGRFDDVVGTGWTLVGGAAALAALPADLADWFVGLGGSIVALGGPRTVSPATASVTDLDDTYGRWLAGHGAVAVVQRPDFYVYGSATDPSGVAPLLERLRSDLPGRPGGRAPDRPPSGSAGSVGRWGHPLAAADHGELATGIVGRHPTGGPRRRGVRGAAPAGGVLEDVGLANLVGRVGTRQVRGEAREDHHPAGGHGDVVRVGQALPPERLDVGVGQGAGVVQAPGVTCGQPFAAVASVRATQHVRYCWGSTKA